MPIIASLGALTYTKLGKASPYFDYWALSSSTVQFKKIQQDDQSFLYIPYVINGGSNVLNSGFFRTYNGPIDSNWINNWDFSLISGIDRGSMGLNFIKPFDINNSLGKVFLVGNYRIPGNSPSLATNAEIVIMNKTTGNVNKDYFVPAPNLISGTESRVPTGVACSLNGNNYYWICGASNEVNSTSSFGFLMALNGNTEAASTAFAQYFVIGSSPITTLLQLNYGINSGAIYAVGEYRTAAAPTTLIPLIFRHNQGSVVWSRRINGVNGQLNAFCLDNNENSYCITNDSTFTPDRAYLYKLNSNGIMQWSVYISANLFNFQDIATDNNYVYVVAQSPTSTIIYMIFDLNGNLIAQREISTTQSLSNYTLTIIGDSAFITCIGFTSLEGIIINIPKNGTIIQSNWSLAGYNYTYGISSYVVNAGTLSHSSVTLTWQGMNNATVNDSALAWNNTPYPDTNVITRLA